MSTTTTVEPVPPQAALARHRVGVLNRRLEQLARNITPAQASLAAASLLARFGIVHDDASRNLGLAVKLATLAAVKGAASYEEVETALASLADAIERGAFPELADGLEARYAPEPDSAPRPSLAPHDQQQPFPAPTLPVVNPADPLSAMAAGMVPHLSAIWRAEATRAAAAELGKLQPLLDGFQEALSRGGGRGAALDESSLDALLRKRMGNGIGEQIRTLAEPEVRAAVHELLDHARLAATRPKMTEEVQLTAAAVADPDPTYAWTPDLLALADMIEAASTMSAQNALLVGPSGCGKTSWATEFAARFGRRVFIMDCGNVREGRDWFGQKGASGGSTYFRKSQFWLAVEAGRVVVVLDEFNRAPDHVKNQLLPLLDHRRRTYVDEVQETLRVGPATVFFATLNEGLDYTGTHAVDRAMKNRFPRRIELTYLSDAKERTVLLEKVPGLDRADAERLVDLANTIRAKATGFGGGLSETLSTRQIIAAAEDFVRVGPRSFQFTVFNHFSAEGGMDSERAQVIAAFEGKGYNLTPDPAPSA